jgi:hypothetical protein
MPGRDFVDAKRLAQVASRKTTPKARQTRSSKPSAPGIFERSVFARTVGDSDGSAPGSGTFRSAFEIDVRWERQRPRSPPSLRQCARDLRQRGTNDAEDRVVGRRMLRLEHVVHRRVGKGTMSSRAIPRIGDGGLRRGQATPGVPTRGRGSRTSRRE